MLSALLLAGLLAAVTAAVLDLIGVMLRNIAAGVIGLVIASLLWLPVTRRWSARAHVCWAATTYLFVAYLVFMLHWTFASDLGVAGTIGGLILLGLGGFAAVPGCAFLWGFCDALGRGSW